MKNIQVIDNGDNCVYDIFAVTDEEFSLIFQEGEDIAFIDEVYLRAEKNGIVEKIDAALANSWDRRVKKSDVMGIDGVLFYGLDHKKRYYPTRRDEEATNPDGSRLRRKNT